MLKERVYELLKTKISHKNILIDEPMSKHTSFRIGGPADFFIVPTSEEELMDCLKICKVNSINHYVIGNGSNLLVEDKGYNGVIIQIYKNMNKIFVEDNYIIAESGALLSKIAKVAYDNSFRGFEFASGIPGTLGGAIYMNAGAYDGEMKDVLVEAKIVDIKGNISTLSKEELKLGYRKSIVQQDDSIILSGKIKLEKGNKEKIKSLMDDLNNRRKIKQPIDMPSAGSTFKRPDGYYAGKLIMDSGLRGYSIGGAQVSEKHCGFVVNKGNATFNDVVLLIEHVRTTVNNMFGVLLEPEVRIIYGKEDNK
jgi:UDP-N-acetylmuramate dehydrogenase